MRFDVLGPLRVRRGGQEVAIAARERVLIAMLLLHPHHPVELTRLVDAIWEATPPRNARNQVQTCVYRLRKAFSELDVSGRSMLVTTPGGYRIDTDNVDLLEFQRLLAEARDAATQGQHATARDGYRAALALWRGPALADIDSDVVRKAAVALDEERGRAIEERIGLELALGAGGELVAELTDLVGQYPYRESLHGALMVALVRAGRQADALIAYQRARRLLVEEIGTEPGAELRGLHQRVLAGDPDLLADTSPSEVSAAGHAASRSLPRGVADFTGRRAEVDQLVQATRVGAGSMTVIAVDGMAGVGKTALAIRVAHLLTDDFPDAQLYLDLRGHSDHRPMEPAEALETLLRQLGVPGGRIPTDEQERAALWRSELVPRRALLVLDNAANTAQVTPLLPAGAGCLVLVTSRRRLTGLDAARPLSLAPLHPEAAVTLLARIAGDRVGREPEAAVEVAKQCGHLPLAIRLAGARLVHRPNWLVSDLADRLRDAGGLLVELRADDRSVADALALSYAPLPPEQQRFFRLLSVHPGRDFDRYAATALVDGEVAGTQRLLDEFVDRHLLEEVHPGRYRFHDLVGKYAQQLAAAEEPEPERGSALERLLDFYLHATAAATAPLEEANGPRYTHRGFPLRPDLVSGAQSWGTAWLEAERANLVAAVRRATTIGLDRYAWQITRAAWRFLFLGSYVDDLLATHRDGLVAAKRLGSTDAVATMLNYLASGYYRAGDCETSLDLLRQALQLRQKSGDQAEEAVLRMNQASVLHRLGRFEESIRSDKAALAIRRGMGDVPAIGTSLDNMGWTYIKLGRYQQALSSLRRGLVIARESGETSTRAKALGHLGLARIRLGQHQMAVRLLAAAVMLSRRSGDQANAVEFLSYLGSAYRELGQHREAMDRQWEALRSAQEIGDRPVECLVRNDLGATLRATGDLAAALDHFREALSTAQRGKIRYEQARALDGIAACLVATDPAAARRHWAQAYRLYLEMGVPEHADVSRRLDELATTA